MTSDVKSLRRRSPLGPLADTLASVAPGSEPGPGSAPAGPLTFVERPFRVQVELRIAPDAPLPAVEGVLGFRLPQQVGTVTRLGERHALCLAPRWWLVTDRPEEDAHLECELATSLRAAASAAPHEPSVSSAGAAASAAPQEASAADIASREGSATAAAEATRGDAPTPTASGADAAPHDASATPASRGEIPGAVDGGAGAAASGPSGASAAVVGGAAPPEMSGVVAGGLSAVDVSAQRTTVDVSGVHARAVLAHGCALGLDPGVFGVDACAQTTVAKAQVVLQRLPGDSTFRIHVRATYAVYLAQWLLDAAVEYV